MSSNRTEHQVEEHDLTSPIFLEDKEDHGVETVSISVATLRPVEEGQDILEEWREEEDITEAILSFGDVQ
ncbi:hypothetical protein BJ165DRAFT_1525743 [Panaeolus papilionaceus]|nr:hypothetical protein BJ165DRAFT_1525743 [Panaeolus papilionaceus]